MGQIAHGWSLMRTVTSIAVAGMWTLSTSAFACVEDILGEAVTIDRAAESTSSGDKAAINVLGGGWLQAAEIVKEGGSSDETYVTLELDGQTVITTSFALLRNPWMQLNTPYIVANVRTEGNKRTMTIWYSPGLRFMGIVALHVEVQEEGVDSVRMRAVMNRAIHLAPLPGMPTTASALPAFK